MPLSSLWMLFVDVVVAVVVVDVVVVVYHSTAATFARGDESCLLLLCCPDLCYKLGAAACVNMESDSVFRCKVPPLSFVFHTL